MSEEKGLVKQSNAITTMREAEAIKEAFLTNLSMTKRRL